jgi:hypothetical protein
VPVLLVVRGIDFLVLAIVGQGSMFASAVLVACLATVNLIAMWTVLGRDLWLVRLAVILATPLLIAPALGFYAGILETQYGRWSGPPVINLLIEVREYWTSWLWLDTALTAALLLYIRANGYYLSREKWPTHHSGPLRCQ